MKLNYKRTILVGFAFFLICAFWQAYDNTIPLILTNKFGMSQTWSGVIMAMDNVLALFMLPLFGKLSDKTRTKIGRRMPYILGGTILALLCLAIMPAAQKQNNALLFFIGLGLVLIAMATYRSPAVALMPDVTPKPLRSQGNAVINLMGAFGGLYTLIMMKVAVTTDAAGNANYTALFASVAGLMVTAIAILVLTIREKKLVAEMKAINYGVNEDEDQGKTETVNGKEKLPKPAQTPPPAEYPVKPGDEPKPKY